MSPEPEIRLVETCSWCPEQYDAFVGAVQVGYLRLRHGVFTVNFPDVGGETILCEHPNGDGHFEDEERDKYLEMARTALRDRLNAGRPGL